MVTKRSAFEKLNRKLEGESEGDVNITIVVDADADAVEEALDQEALDTEVSEGETTADLEEASQEEAAELSAIAGVLRTHGLNEGMHALLVASGKFAMHNITAPGKESLSATDRNTAVAEQLAVAFEKSESTFWESARKFFSEMWDRIIRIYTWVVTKIGSIRGRCERARDSLKGKVIDPDKAKGSKTDDITKEELDTVGKANAVLVDKLKQVITGFTTDRATENPGLDVEETQLKAATGYTYEGDEKNKLSDADKDFMKTGDAEITSASVGEYADTRWATINTILVTMGKIKELTSSAEGAKKSADKLKALDTAAIKADGGKDANDAKTKAAALRNKMSLLLKVSGKFTKALSTGCSLYIKNCGKVRACCKAGD